MHTDIQRKPGIVTMRTITLNHLNEKESMDKIRGYAKILRSIEKMRFVRFDSKYNPWSMTNFTQLGLISVPFAFEIAWYNEKLLHDF